MTLVVLVGPPAVGKMTVGHALAARTGFRLLHNHVTSDVVTRFFPYGTPEFSRLNTEFRVRIVEEVATSALPGLIFTYVWAFDDPRDADHVERLAAIFRARGRAVRFVELQASQAVRLARNETSFRLAEKPPKRDLAASRAHLLAVDARYRLSSGDAFAGRDDWLRLETDELAADEVAERIVAAFGLPRVGDAGDAPASTMT